MQTSSTILKDTQLAKDIIEFIEPSRIMRPFCFDYGIPRLSAILPKKYASGMAIEVAEGSDIPIFRTRMDTEAIRVVKNATNFFLTKEAEIEDFNGQIYQTEATESGMRMLRKEDYDIANVLMAGAAVSESASDAGDLSTYDVSYMKAKLKAQPEEYDATDLIINPIQWPDIEGEATLQDLPYTSEAAKKDGAPLQQAQTVMGLKVSQSNKIPAGTAFVYAQAAKPIWFVYYNSTITEPYLKEGVGRGAIVITYHKPVVMRGNAIGKIIAC
jgi:hypothetical protein